MAIHLNKYTWGNRTIVICWLLLIYVLAALIWWYIALNLQNNQMSAYRIALLTHDDPSYISKLEKISSDRQRLATAYKSEGLAFLLVILAGAVFLRSAVMRQIRIQKQQQNFMMAITHELKTPISVAKLNLETLLKYSLDPERQKKLIRMTLEETSRLNFLTNNILIASQLEAGGYKSAKEELDLSGLLKDRIHDFRNRFPERIFKEN